MLINNEFWNIRFVYPNDEILYIGNGKYTLGVTVPEWKTIFISDDLRGELLRRVIAHEIAHAEFASRGLIVPVYVEEVLADIVSDNIVDTNNLTNDFCYCTGRC